MLILKLNRHFLKMKLVFKKMKANGLHKVVNRSIIVIEIKGKTKHQILIIKNHHRHHHQNARRHQKNKQHQHQQLHHRQIKMNSMLKQQEHQMFLFHHHQKFKNQLKFVNYYQRVKIVIPLMIIGGNKH